MFVRSGAVLVEQVEFTSTRVGIKFHFGFVPEHRLLVSLNRFTNIVMHADFNSQQVKSLLREKSRYSLPTCNLCFLPFEQDTSILLYLICFSFHAGFDPRISSYI